MGHRSLMGAGITENMCSHDVVMLLILSPFNNEEYWCGFKMTADFTGLWTNFVVAIFTYGFQKCCFNKAS